MNQCSFIKALSPVIRFEETPFYQIRLYAKHGRPNNTSVQIKNVLNNSIPTVSTTRRQLVRVKQFSSRPNFAICQYRLFLNARLSRVLGPNNAHAAPNPYKVTPNTPNNIIRAGFGTPDRTDKIIINGSRSGVCAPRFHSLSCSVFTRERRLVRCGSRGGIEAESLNVAAA